MKREEIERAIENGESVWVVDLKNKIITENKRHKHFKKLLATQRENRIPFDRIFTTRRQAEHYLHHANITRTETLPFLTWEELCEQKFIWFIDKNQNECCLYYLNVSNKIFINVSGEVKEIGDLTEANFYKAYDECVRLFKGEE